MGVFIENGSIEFQIRYSSTITHYATAAMPPLPAITVDFDSRKKKQ